MERRLAAILAADVVGYSRLIEQDEAGTFERLRAHQKELFEPEIAKHHGRVFKLAGDGLLAEFGSTVNAVECAVALQRGMAERNTDVAEDRRIDVRIGLHVGDVIVENDDLHGDAVIIAARLQQIAEAGGICVSHQVAEQVRRKVALRFESQGEERLKNIAEPVSIYRVAGTGAPGKSRRQWLGVTWQAVAVALLLVSAGAGAGWYFYGKPPLEPSEVASSPDAALGLPIILVLPFENLSGDPSQDVLGISIAEDLRDLLWSFTEFQVVSRTSSTIPADVALSLTDMARRFGAQFVIEGSVRQSGNKVIVTAQLIDGTTDVHLWSNRFEETVSDPFALEGAVATRLSDSLSGITGKVHEAYERIAWSKAEGDLTQYDYTVRGHTHHLRFTDDEVARARDIYLAGLGRFPDSALLRIKIGMTHLTDVYLHYWSKDTTADLAQARKLLAEAEALLAAQRKSRLEERQLHYLSAPIRQSDRNFGECITEAKAAVALDPYDSFMRNDLAGTLAACGSPDEAVEWVKEAIRRDPEGPRNTPEMYKSNLVWVSYLADRCQDAIGVIHGMKDKPLWLLATCEVRLGQLEEARSTMAAVVKDFPDWTVNDEAASPFAMVERLRQRWLDDLRKAGLPE